MNIIIWATQCEFHSSRTEMGQSWITGAAVQTRNIWGVFCFFFLPPSRLEPTGVAKALSVNVAALGKCQRRAPLFSNPEASLLMSTFKGVHSRLLYLVVRH